MSDEENSITFEKEGKLIEHSKDSEDSCSEEQSIQKEISGTECSNECFSDDNDYDGDSDKSCSSYHLLVSKCGMNQLFQKHDGSNSDRSIQSFNSNTGSSEDLFIAEKCINTDCTSGKISTNSAEREKECQLIAPKDFEKSCLEEQSHQKEKEIQCTYEFNRYDDKSCSSSDLLVSSYGTNQMLAKHGGPNSNCSSRSYNSNTESSEYLLHIKDINTDYTSRTSSTNSFERIELIRPEDERVKTIKSIDENREVRWPVKRKIDKNLYKRRLNARVRRLVSPKSALVVFSELYRGVPIQIECQTFLNGKIYTAMIEIDGQIYVANNISKIEAKQKACENLFRNMLAKQFSEEKKESSVDIEMEDGKNGAAQKPIGPPEEDFPWPHFASLAMYKLLNHWKIQPASKDINLQDKRPFAIQLPPKVAAPMKMFPEDPSKYHPAQLINQMKPGTKFIATCCLNRPSWFEVSCVIDGVPFTGQHTSKKAAKNEACIAAINYFWKFNFHDI